MLKNNFLLLPPEKLPHNQKELIFLQNSKNTILLKNSFSEIIHKNDLFIIIQKILKSYEKKIKNFSIISNDCYESKKNHDNDLAFRIIRVDGPILEVLNYSVIKTYHLLFLDLKKSGTSLSRKNFNILIKTLFTLLFLYNPNTHCSISNKFYSKLKIKNYIDKYNAYKRWIHGHYLFMVIIQGLIISLQCFIFEYSKKKFLQSLLYLDNAIKLMKATEVALYYTGEFSSKSYNENVRPTLMPPISQPEMSGLNWRDHQFMVKNCMRSIGKLNFTSCPIIQKKYNSFIISLKKAYHAHKYVCGKFVGPASGSLRSNEYSAVQEIEKFKKLRLKILKG